MAYAHVEAYDQEIEDDGTYYESMMQYGDLTKHQARVLWWDAYILSRAYGHCGVVIYDPRSWDGQMFTDVEFWCPYEALCHLESDPETLSTYRLAAVEELIRMEWDHTADVAIIEMFDNVTSEDDWTVSVRGMVTLRWE